MTHVVLEGCINCKYTTCVDVCPVNCFHEGPNMLVIDPLECVNCGICIPECPTQAIVPEKLLQEQEQHMLEFNRKYAGIWPVIDSMKPAMLDAEKWAGYADKAHLIEF
ncbi:ferredoxin FdxA [Paludibacterium purpuratum]|uniref:Ferredoxin n=1 Tax=Paludibacterium purpuratum TaxID=1144873 RepID=A0A4R7B5V5_9NEIS|nr:ferredoxin FdxA [Paludibacterium purpuratum]TDR80064.1 ferredoxin [Paludibacterium purpuratum]